MDRNNSLYPIIQNEARLELLEKYDLDIQERGCMYIQEDMKVPLMVWGVVRDIWGNPHLKVIAPDYIKILEIVKQ